MANYIIDGTLLTNIAAAIRSKKGVSTTYTPTAMANAINGLAPKSTDGSGTLIEHNVGILEASGVTISAGDTRSFRVPTGSDTYLDFSDVAFTSFSIQCSGGTAYVSRIDLVQAHITFLNVGYVDLVIV